MHVYFAVLLNIDIYACLQGAATPGTPRNSPTCEKTSSWQYGVGVVKLLCYRKVAKLPKRGMHVIILILWTFSSTHQLYIDFIYIH